MNGQASLITITSMSGVRTLSSSFLVAFKTWANWRREDFNWKDTSCFFRVFARMP